MVRTVIFAGGMGHSVSDKLYKNGQHVIAIDQHTERLNTLSEQYGSAIIILDCDLSKGEFSELKRVLDETERLKGLVNLAGCSFGDSLDKLSDKDWQYWLRVNSTAPMKLARLVSLYLVSQNGGAILNVFSPVGLIGVKEPSYAASKAALTVLAISLARNLDRDNIRVNMVLPATTSTYMKENWSEEKRNSIAKGIHLGRTCDPSEFADMLYFLCSD